MVVAPEGHAHAGQLLAGEGLSGAAGPLIDHLTANHQKNASITNRTTGDRHWICLIKFKITVINTFKKIDDRLQNFTEELECILKESNGNLELKYAVTEMK